MAPFMSKLTRRILSAEGAEGTRSAWGPFFVRLQPFLAARGENNGWDRHNITPSSFIWNFTRRIVYFADGSKVFINNSPSDIA